jgi:ubiquitin carboxyl-terminal hydrolase 8
LDIAGAFRQHINRSNKAGTGGILVESFSELLRVMWSENYNFISPMTFRDALVRFAPQFSGRDQQDSQEFLMLLLDGLHEDMNQHASQSRAIMKLSSSTNDLEEELKFEKLPDWQASAIAWEKYLAKNTSIIVDLFQGQYRSRLTCLSCKQVNLCNGLYTQNLIEPCNVDFHNI